MRLHLFEIEDQRWCPATIRDAATDYLEFVVERFNPYAPIVPRLAAAIARSGNTQVLDLCSGAGGPWRSLLSDVARRGSGASIMLSDRYPNSAVAREINRAEATDLRYFESAVDATDVPVSLQGFRTMFASFHHFAPDPAQRILRNAVSRRCGVGIVELTERRAPAILGMLLTPIVLWVVTPLIRPFRWSRLLWTYLIPLVPLVVVWDGIVSCLRTYTPAELRAMTADLTEFEWDIGTTRAPGMASAITWLFGVPKPRS